MFSRGWVPFCQYQLPNGTLGRRGAKRTIDFVASLRANKQDQLALEIKLIGSRTNSRTHDFSKDREKLMAFKLENPLAKCYLLVAGRKADIKPIKIVLDQSITQPRERDFVIADVGRTAWGSCLIKVEK
jgi:hypothetical protein